MIQRLLKLVGIGLANRKQRLDARLFCSACGAPVGADKVRSCDHNDAAIIAPMTATLYGEAHVRAGHPEAIKLLDTTPAEG